MADNVIELSPEIRQIITADQAWTYKIVPHTFDNEAIEFYVDDQHFSPDLESELNVLFGKNIHLKECDPEIVNNTLTKYYPKANGSETEKAEDLKHSQDFFERLFDEAEKIDSSDVHLEPYEDRCRIRFRVDGKLTERFTVDTANYSALVNQIKIKANLDIAEKRLPQDGRIIQGKEVKTDVRVSTLPTLHGEKVVLRLLKNDTTDVNLDKLGLNEREYHAYLKGVQKSSGIILISGPTGSGKTTTLYATLKMLNKKDVNILTIEDPIEYTLEGINQVQLQEKIGLSFGRALRTFLRQDPDIIMLGEIRDAETAMMAIRAALTGHLVLSTIHTNSAWGTISRLIDMDIPAFLLADTLNTTVAQRLVRILCPHCKESHALNPQKYPEELTRMFQNLSHCYEPVGCNQCFFTGYKGRKAIYEVIPIEDGFKESIKMEKPTIDEELNEKGIHTLQHNAFNLLENGETSIEEVLPVLLNQ